MKTLKKFLILFLILLLKFTTSIYAIISKFWKKNKGKLKNIVTNIEQELRKVA